MKLNSIFRYPKLSVEKKMKIIKICLLYGIINIPQQRLSAPPQQHIWDNSVVFYQNTLCFIQWSAELRFKYLRPTWKYMDSTFVTQTPSLCYSLEVLLTTSVQSISGSGTWLVPCAFQHSFGNFMWPFILQNREGCFLNMF